VNHIAIMELLRFSSKARSAMDKLAIDRLQQQFELGRQEAEKIMESAQAQRPCTGCLPLRSSPLVASLP